MTDLQVGDKLRDNDPRSGGRVLTITALDSRYTYATSGTRRTRIERSRIYNHDQTRRSGFTRLPREAVAMPREVYCPACGETVRTEGTTTEFAAFVGCGRCLSLVQVIYADGDVAGGGGYSR